MNLNDELNRFLESNPRNEIFHNESQSLINWFFENIDRLPREKFNIWETKHGRETWHEPQKVYDFIITAIHKKGSDFEQALKEIRKLKNKIESDQSYEIKN